MQKNIDRVGLALVKLEAAHRDHPIYPNRVTPRVIAQVVSEQTSIPVSALSKEIPAYVDIEATLNGIVTQEPGNMSAQRPKNIR